MKIKMISNDEAKIMIFLFKDDFSAIPENVKKTIKSKATFYDLHEKPKLAIK